MADGSFLADLETDISLEELRVSKNLFMTYFNFILGTGNCL
jgi:hypothetical protein